MINSATNIIAPAELKEEFHKDVREGLLGSPKSLKSKYFYDQKGDELFQQIMTLPEYYLTDSELEILESKKEKILDMIPSGESFQFIDLGAGDAFKTKELLKFFMDEKVTFTYVPVDISESAIRKVTGELRAEIPGIDIQGINKDYLKALDSLSINRKIILFLGASIGNFSSKETLRFLKEISSGMDDEDLFIIGFDLRKDPDIILAAYNDNRGVTKKFNLNLLSRINRELGANFDVNAFEHSPHYDPESGEAKSALVSKKDQIVKIRALEITVELEAGERIHTEISRKYSLKEIEELAEASGFQIVEHLLDSRTYFTDSVWKKKK